jgi:hypothetical protein
MKRTQLNFAIDGAAFFAFLLLLSTGLLLQYQLPVGSGGLEGRGAGHGAGGREISLLWGWTRHEWGQIHYWIAGLLVTVLATHVILHWKWIVSVVKGAHNDSSGYRFGVGLASLVGLGLLAVMPLVSNTEHTTRRALVEQRNSNAAISEGQQTADLRGSMTVQEVAQTIHLSVAELLGQLGLPADTDQSERIGRLLRQHGMQMSDLHGLRQSSKDAQSQSSR